MAKILMEWSFKFPNHSIYHKVIRCGGYYTHWYLDTRYHGRWFEVTTLDNAVELLDKITDMIKE
jgi:hypothetical protein